MQELLTADTNKKFKSDNYFIVYQVSAVKNIDPTIKNQQIKVVELQARNQLCKYVFEEIKNFLMQYRDIVYTVYMNEAKINNEYRIRGIEFITLIVV